MNHCGCGAPMLGVYPCSFCDVADQRRRAGVCVDCAGKKGERAVGVYCRVCFGEWLTDVYNKGSEKNEEDDSHLHAADIEAHR